MLILLNDQLLTPEAANSTSPLLLSLGIAFGIIAYALFLLASWKLLRKAGQPGWKSLIPFYQLFVLCKIVDGKGIKFLLLFIPVVNVIYSILLGFRMARAYGKSIGFGLGLIFLPHVFLLILGFGAAEYLGAQN